MSGRAKQITYSVVNALGLCAAIASMILMWYFSHAEAYLLAIAAVVLLLLPLNVLVHECGHLVFGLLSGMKFVSVRVGHVLVNCFKRPRLQVSLYTQTAGESAFFPRSGGRMRGRHFATTVGGAALNLCYGAIFLPLYFLLPAYPALLFFELFAPLCIFEGFAALYPAELPAGKTDGRVAFDILRNSAEENVAIRVLEAQGILYRGAFEDIPEETLFGAPVVRADLPALHALLLLQMQFLLAKGRRADAEAVFIRLSSFSEELTEEAKEELARYGRFFRGGKLESCGGPLRGIALLEAALTSAENEKILP